MQNISDSVERNVEDEEGLQVEQVANAVLYNHRLTNQIETGVLSALESPQTLCKDDTLLSHDIIELAALWPLQRVLGASMSVSDQILLSSRQILATEATFSRENRLQFLFSKNNLNITFKKS